MIYYGRMNAEDVKSSLQKLADPLRAKNSAWFFKTGPGQYGEGDQFIGVTVPDQRKIAAAYREMPLQEVGELLRSPIHEHRLTALIILVQQYRNGDRDAKKQIASFYHKNRTYVNNWDLVDSSAPYILGDYLKTHSPNVLFRLAAAKSTWDRRIAILSTFAFVKDGQFDLTLKIAAMLLNDKEDLIHKATGWALREVGKKDHQALLNFLDQHAGRMPRTALRYAIERLSPEERQLYMGR
jgi:3-methyladenine DNA glycosylase AlkD